MLLPPVAAFGIYLNLYLNPGESLAKDAPGRGIEYSPPPPTGDILSLFVCVCSSWGYGFHLRGCRAQILCTTWNLRRPSTWAKSGNGLGLSYSYSYSQSRSQSRRTQARLVPVYNA